MSKVFQSIITTVLNGEELFTAVDNHTVREKPLNDKIIDVSWDNVDDVLKEYGEFLPFSVIKGVLSPFSRRIEFNALQVRQFIRIKKRKTPNLNIQVKIQWVETACPFGYPMEWTDSNEAIQYLGG